MNFNQLPAAVLVAFAHCGGELLNLLQPSDFADELADLLEACVQELALRATDDDTQPLDQVQFDDDDKPTWALN